MVLIPMISILEQGHTFIHQLSVPPLPPPPPFPLIPLDVKDLREHPSQAFTFFLPHAVYKLERIG